MFKYTDAYWFYDSHGDGTIKATVNGEEITIVDEYWVNSGHGVEDEEEQQGNMKLIENAPVMYRAIKDFIDGYHTIKDLEILIHDIEK